MIEEEQLDGSEQVKFHYYGVLKSVASRLKNDGISENAMRKNSLWSWKDYCTSKVSTNISGDEKEQKCYS